MKDLISKAITATRESKLIEFKQTFDKNSNRDWIEIVKDIVAMANSGGGIVLFGLDNFGEPCDTDIEAIKSIDPAVFTDKIYSYTGIQFSDLEIIRLSKSNHEIVGLSIGPAEIPIVFSSPGTYQEPGMKKQKTAFGKGTIFYRHGAKSEQGNYEDIRSSIERRLKQIRKEWMDGVRKVVEAPIGSIIRVLPSEVIESTSAEATPIRIVDDPDAPAYRRIDPNISHPYRQKDVLAELKKHLPPDVKVSAFDFYAVRRLYNITEQDRFYYRPIQGSPQYSKDFIVWLIQAYREDNSFFIKARRNVISKRNI